jgi:hypothetical protein
VRTIMGIALLLGLVAANAPAQVKAADSGNGTTLNVSAARTVVRDFYGWYYARGGGVLTVDLAPVKTYFDPELFRAVEGLCPCNMNLFTNGTFTSQSYVIGSPFIKDGRALVPVRTQVFNSATYAHLTVIVKRNASGVYVIDDLIYYSRWVPPSRLRTMVRCCAVRG